MYSRRWSSVAVALTFAAAQALAQEPAPVVKMVADAHPSFAVATIKPHDPDSNRQTFDAKGDRVIILAQTITSMMMFAFGIDKHQVVDGPDWVRTDRFDIEGTTDTPGEPNLRQQQEMLRKLLADRFQLKFHHDKREIPVYTIRVAKGGPKLKQAANPDAEANQTARVHGTEITVTITSATMADFIMGMQFFLDRPMIDQTHLTGKYDFTVQYTHDEIRATDPDAPPGIYTAIQEQLGLKLDAVKAPADVFVIDQVERPSPN